MSDEHELCVRCGKRPQYDGATNLCRVCDEADLEIAAFRAHLEQHRSDSAPDCPFCDQRDAKKPKPPAQPDHLPIDELLRDVLIVDGVCQECREGVPCGFHTPTPGHP